MTTARRIAVVSGIVLIALVGVTTAAIGALRLVHDGEILPGVTVAGVDVGGLGSEAAAEALSEAAAARTSDPVVLLHDDERFTVRPDDVGFEADIDATVQRALDSGRDGGFLRASWRHLRSYWTEVEVPLVLHLDEDALADEITGIADDVDAAPFPGAIGADPDSLEVAVSAPEDGVAVDRDATREAAEEALRSPGREEIELPVETDPTTVTMADVERVAETARAALEAPLTLRANDAEVSLTPAEIAPMLALAAQDGDGGTEVELTVTVDAVEEAFRDVDESFEKPAVDAQFDIPRAPPVQFDDQGATSWEPVPVDIGVVPSEPGEVFDAEVAATQIAELLRDGARNAQLRLTEVEADLTTEEARDFELTHLLGTFTTYHACCANRVTNIHRLADMVDGATVRPGEQFSVNQISGVRECSKGFAPAGMILDGEIVDVCGGGVSQFGTTTFNAAFFAGVPIDAYKAHSFYISRYPMGREATLNYPSPDIDVRFTNDTDHGMLVRTSYTGTSITVSIYGNSTVEEVRATLSGAYNHKPYSTEVRENKALPPGTSRVVQSGASGFTAQVDRIVTHESGDTDERTFTTIYVPKKEIIERNSSPPAPPPEEEQPPSGDSGDGDTDDGSTDDGGTGDGDTGDGSGGDSGTDGGDGTGDGGSDGSSDGDQPLADSDGGQ